MLTFLVRRSLRPRYSHIASSILVTNDWRELPCEKPARPHGHSQRIQLKIPGYKFDTSRVNFEIRLPDGRVIRPMIEVVDSSGKRFEAKDSTRVGDLVGFRVQENVEQNLSLDDTLQSVTVRIRSDEPFECESIKWVTKRLK